MSQNFKAIPGFSEYRIDDQGVVLNRHDKKLSPHNGGGYMFVGIQTDEGKRKNMSLHRLVWMTHAGPIPKGYWINHKNGIKADNRLENLECNTPKYNLLHARDVLGHQFGTPGEKHPRARLTVEHIHAIKLLAASGWSHKRTAKLFGVTPTAVTLIVNGKRWGKALATVAPRP